MQPVKSIQARTGMTPMQSDTKQPASHASTHSGALPPQEPHDDYSTASSYTEDDLQEMGLEAFSINILQDVGHPFHDRFVPNARCWVSIGEDNPKPAVYAGYLDVHAEGSVGRLHHFDVGRSLDYEDPSRLASMISKGSASLSVDRLTYMIHDVQVGEWTVSLQRQVSDTPSQEQAAFKHDWARWGSGQGVDFDPARHRGTRVALAVHLKSIEPREPGRPRFEGHCTLPAYLQDVRGAGDDLVVTLRAAWTPADIHGRSINGGTGPVVPHRYFKGMDICNISAVASKEYNKTHNITVFEFQLSRAVVADLACELDARFQAPAGMEEWHHGLDLSLHHLTAQGDSLKQQLLQALPLPKDVVNIVADYVQQPSVLTSTLSAQGYQQVRWDDSKEGTQFILNDSVWLGRDTDADEPCYQARVAGFYDLPRTDGEFAAGGTYVFDMPEVPADPTWKGTFLQMSSPDCSSRLIHIQKDCFDNFCCLMPEIGKRSGSLKTDELTFPEGFGPLPPASIMHLEPGTRVMLNVFETLSVRCALPAVFKESNEKGTSFTFTSVGWAPPVLADETRSFSRPCFPGDAMGNYLGTLDWSAFAAESRKETASSSGLRSFEFQLGSRSFGGMEDQGTFVLMRDPRSQHGETAARGPDLDDKESAPPRPTSVELPVTSLVPVQSQLRIAGTNGQMTKEDLARVMVGDKVMIRVQPAGLDDSRREVMAE